MASGLALAGAAISGAALGAIVALRAMAIDPASWRLVLWSGAVLGGFGAILAWRSGLDALVAFLLCAAVAALIETRTMARIARRPSRQEGV